MSEERYRGSTWRSRFLRAPKIAFEIAARKEFVPLAQLASVRLGLKTGCDRFFFVRRDPDATYRASQQPLGISRGTVPIVGMNEWHGRVAANDLLPAILNPHQFVESGARRFVVPKVTQSLYLYPRDTSPRNELADYIWLAEHEDVHKGQLVRANGSGQRWYRQSRALVTSPWALPYNSAYDYGALDNAVGAVLNGRFIGVDTREEVDSELLGAALASSFVLVTRLLEGVPTGVEGALDVGPPAARLMMVPDVRRLSVSGTRAVRKWALLKCMWVILPA